MLSYFESLVRDVFSPYKEVVCEYNARPSFLWRLELDLYFYNNNFAIEVNWVTHKYSSYTIENDKKKKKLCRENNVVLLSIFHPRDLLSKNNKRLIKKHLWISLKIDSELRAKMDEYHFNEKKQCRKFNVSNKKKWKSKKERRLEKNIALQKEETRLNRLRMWKINGNWEQ